MKILIVSLFILFGFFAASRRPATGKYIRIEHGIRGNKPLPNILFHTDSSFDWRLIKWGQAFRVPKEEFAKLENLIKTSDILEKSGGALGFYMFTIVENDDDQRYLAGNTTAMQKMFTAILNVLQDEKTRGQVDTLMDEINHRLDVEFKIKN